jgi:hypothetical protein
MPLQTSYIVAGAILIIILMCFPLVLQAWVRGKVKGRMLAGIIEKGKPLGFKLLKLDGDMMHDGSDDFLIIDKQVKLVQFPMGWPKILGSFQQTVGCSLYIRGQGEPLDWENPKSKVIDSKELRDILDPYWLRALVKGVIEETQGIKKGGSDRMMIFLSVGCSAICLILLFVVMTKLSALQTAVKLIHP